MNRPWTDPIIEEAQRQAGFYRMPLPSRERRRRFYRGIPEGHARLANGEAIGLITRGEADQMYQLSKLFFHQGVKEYLA